MDSGATRHMTPQREFFVKFHPWDGVVQFRNSGEPPVLGRGEFYSRRAFPDSTNFRWDFILSPSFRPKSSHFIISEARPGKRCSHFLARPYRLAEDLTLPHCPREIPHLPILQQLPQPCPFLSDRVGSAGVSLMVSARSLATTCPSCPLLPLCPWDLWDVRIESDPLLYKHSIRSWIRISPSCFLSRTIIAGVMELLRSKTQACTWFITIPAPLLLQHPFRSGMELEVKITTYAHAN